MLFSFRCLTQNVRSPCPPRCVVHPKEGLWHALFSEGMEWIGKIHDSPYGSNVRSILIVWVVLVYLATLLKKEEMNLLKSSLKDFFRGIILLSPIFLALPVAGSLQNLRLLILSIMDIGSVDSWSEYNASAKNAKEGGAALVRNELVVLEQNNHNH